MLLLMKPEVIHSVSRHVAYGLHDLLKTNAANIHAAYDWCTLFTLLEVVGAGTNPPPLMHVRPGVNVSQVVMDAGTRCLLMLTVFNYCFYTVSQKKVAHHTLRNIFAQG